ncbi:MAG: TetR/AcrR family transcriptional regulator [Solirubrobacteraceae bacterium]
MTRRRPETRARLLDAAFGVFAARGFGRASIEEVCEAAGYTRGAFYSNFDTLDELFFALYTERSDLLAHHVAAGLAHAPTDIPELLAQAVQALMVDRDWILVSTDFRLYAARNPEVAAALRAHRNKLRDALATTLAPAIDRSPLPASLRTPDGLARAVMAIHDGATTELLLDNDPAQFKSWLTDLLTALLDHPPDTRLQPAKRPATNFDQRATGNARNDLDG